MKNYTELNILEIEIQLTSKSKTKKEMASFLGISISTVSLILNKKQNITFPAFIQLVNFLEVEPQILLK